MKKNIFFHLILILLSLSITSCAKSSELDSSAYPIDNYGEEHIGEYESGPSLAYPSYRLETPTIDANQQIDPTSNSANTDLVIPSPNADSVIIHGTLISNKTNQPLPSIQLLLANLVPINPGPGYIISTSESSPETYTNDKGEFLFDNIAPNNYVLILKTPFTSYPIVDINNMQIEINAVGGNLIDLGTTYVYWP